MQMRFLCVFCAAFVDCNFYLHLLIVYAYFVFAFCICCLFIVASLRLEPKRTQCKRTLSISEYRALPLLFFKVHCCYALVKTMQ